MTLHYNSGCHDRNLNWASPQWRDKVRAHVPLVRTLEPEIKLARDDTRRALAEGYDSLCSYESNVTVIESRFIELFRSLRR